MERPSRRSLAALIADQTGLHYPEERLGDLQLGIRNACEELKMDDTNQFVHLVLQRDADPRLMQSLINHLTIGETYFLREKPVLDIFTDKLLPEISENAKSGERNLNIWCAGCCTGEEPYTVAILLREHLTDFDKWKIRIDATDINQQFLDKAIAGVYHAWSFRETPTDLLTRYFIREGKNYIIDPQVRSMVNFSRLNLHGANPARVGIPVGRVHMIFCRNVLMYFSAGSISKTYEMFASTLVNDGWCITSSVELPAQAPADFAFRRFGGATLLQKIIRPLSTMTSHAIAPEVKKIKKSPRSSPTLVSPSTKATAQAPKPPKNERILPEKPPLVKATHAFKKKDYTTALEMVGTIPVEAEEEGLTELRLRCLANLGKRQEALDLVEQFLTQQPDRPKLHYLQGLLLQEIGNDTLAETALRRALFLDPMMPMANLLMGNLLQKGSKFAQARKHFDAVLTAIESLADNAEVDQEGITAGFLRATLSTLKKSSAW